MFTCQTESTPWRGSEEHRDLAGFCSMSCDDHIYPPHHHHHPFPTRPPIAATTPQTPLLKCALSVSQCQCLAARHTVDAAIPVTIVSIPAGLGAAAGSTTAQAFLWAICDLQVVYAFLLTMLQPHIDMLQGLAETASAWLETISILCACLMQCTTSQDLLQKVSDTYCSKQVNVQIPMGMYAMWECFATSTIFRVLYIKDVS